MKTSSPTTEAEQKLYIVITQTGTWFSRIVQMFTKDPYNHSSISLNEDLTDMYSFGRKYARFPLPGGFIQECIGKKVFAAHPNTTMIVYELDVTKTQYDEVKRLVHQMIENRKLYAYNLLGIILVPLHKERKARNKFYCSEFVKYILVESKVVDLETLPTFCKPMDFLNITGTKIYEGKMSAYEAGNLLPSL